jgi:hypothetical protein
VIRIAGLGLAWSLAQSILSVVWAVEDGMEIVPGWITRAGML